jgi:hypothetical protein
MQVQSGLNFKILMAHLAKLNFKLISKDKKANFQRWKITLKSTTLNSIPFGPLVWKLWSDNHATQAPLLERMMIYNVATSKGNKTNTYLDMYIEFL